MFSYPEVGLCKFQWCKRLSVIQFCKVEIISFLFLFNTANGIYESGNPQNTSKILLFLIRRPFSMLKERDLEIDLVRLPVHKD
jgi:hypothetical protein